MDHAFASSIDGPNCSGCSALVSESLLTDGWIDQIDLECRRGFVAHECFLGSCILSPGSTLALNTT
jgi:hypothetical protein